MGRDRERDHTTAEEPGASIAVATTSTPVVDANSYRTELNLVNDSDTIIYLRLAGSGALMNKGIRLNADGGSYSSERYDGPVCAIHGSTGTKNLCVTEV